MYSCTAFLLLCLSMLVIHLSRPGLELRKIVDAWDQFEGETLGGNDLSSDQIKRVLKGLTDSLEVAAGL